MTIADIDDLQLLEDIEVSSQQGDPMRFGDSYWRRVDGWLTHAHADEHNINTYREKGMTQLPQYGKFFLTQVLRRDKYGRLIAVEDQFRRPWDTILRQGGAREFPLDQVIAHNWHRNCAYIWWEQLPDKTFNKHTVQLVKDKVRYRDPFTGQRAFPQLDGLVVQDFPCRAHNLMFNYEEHLNAHMMVAHREDMQLEVTRQTVQIIADGLQNNAGDGPIAQAIGQLAQIVGQQQLILQALLDARVPAYTPPEPTSDTPVQIIEKDGMLEEVQNVSPDDVITDPAKQATQEDGWGDLPPTIR